MNKKFRLGDLFKVETGKDLIYSTLIPGKYNVIGHGIENNGITATTDLLDGYKLYDPEQTIPLANRGNFFASVQNKKFYVGTRVKALTAKFKSNKFILMYIATIINKEQFRYSYGRNACDKIEDIVLQLPSIGDTPDYNKMESYIKKIYKDDVLNTKNKNGRFKLNTCDWKKYRIADIFNIKRGVRQKEEDRISGEIEYYSASQENNGLTDKISNPAFIEKNALIYTTFGDCYYVEDEFSASDEISILKNKYLNKYNGIFVATILNKNKYKYQFGRKAFYNKFKNEFILLPSKTNGEVDWDYMEKYIKSIPYGDKI